MLFENGELPDGLIRAHETGRLVLFVGSGASMGAPTSLPNFRDLAERVIEGLGSGRELGESELPEFVLDELAEDGLGVHAQVHRIVCESSQPNSTHRAIAALAMSSPPARIVTTNYDRFLSSGCLGGIREFAAPDLPGGEAFEGIVYLHGSVAQDPENLVVTRADFAQAYMGPLSPTLAFLHRLFTSMPVLFIGYSTDDVLMRYVLQASRGRTELYSLSRGAGRPRHDALGVLRIPYGSHAELPGLLYEWSEFAGSSWTQHNERTRRILMPLDETEAMAPHQESYLTRVVTDPELVLQFTSQASGAKWRRWIVDHPQLDLFDSAPVAGLTTPWLQMWFAEQCQGSDFTADEVAALFDRDGRPLPDWVWFFMFTPGLLHQDQVPVAASRVLAALAEVAPVSHRSHCMRAISTMLSKEKALPDEAFVELATTWCALSTNLVGFRRRHHHTTGFWKDRPHLAVELMGIVDTHLQRASRMACFYEGSDPSSMRASIDGQTGGDVPHRGHLLVDAARDLIAILLDRQPEHALGFLLSWADSQWPILNRLAEFHGSVRVDAGAQLPVQTGDLKPFLLGIDEEGEAQKWIASGDPEGRPGLGFVLVTDAELDEDIARRKDKEAVAGAFAALCFKGDGPKGDEPWGGLRAFTVSTSEPDRVAHIRAVTEGLLLMSPPERSDQWRRWMRGYWEQRLASDPRALRAGEATAIADWSAVLDASDFLEAVKLVTSTPTALDSRSKLPQLLLDVVDSPHPSASVIDSCPREVVEMLAHLLKHTELRAAETYSFAMTDVAQALKDRTDKATFAPLKEQAVRLAWKLRYRPSPLP